MIIAQNIPDTTSYFMMAFIVTLLLLGWAILKLWFDARVIARREANATTDDECPNPTTKDINHGDGI